MNGVCGICGEPAHRFGLGDPDHDYDAMACVNMLRPALAAARADLSEARRQIQACPTCTPPAAHLPSDQSGTSRSEYW